MRTLLAVVAFSLLTVAFFAGYSNFGIPQIEPAPPPEVEELDLAAMSMDEFIALGRRLYEGRGTCTLCHNQVGGRAPLLEEAAMAAMERLADPRYQGQADDVESYLYESMVDPSAYVVAGFGKTGTGDTVSPMPNMLTGRVGLNEAEIRAIIAFLQDLGGVEVTVEIPTEPVADEPEHAEAGEPRPPFATPEEAIAELGCGACHKVAGEEGELGPDLTAIGASRDTDNLRQSILQPNADIAEGFEPDLMPDDYGEQLYAVELEMLVDYLAGLK
ncbi:MAG: c-type cytochrome [Paracoccaceae bacterium]